LQEKEDWYKMHLIKCLKSVRFAYKGIKLLLNENNFKFHILSTLLILVVSFFLKLTIKEWLWVSSAIAVVWVAEAFNTAIERLVDLVSPEFNPLAGDVKDLSAAAVLLAALYAVVVGVLIFFPRVFL